MSKKKNKSPKLRLATVWLDGCSGCHMSIMDLDETLIDLAEIFDVVYSPIVDYKEIPEGIDVALIEGAISNEEDLHKALKLRKNSRLLASLGDCAVTANVPSMRNSFHLNDIFQRAYKEHAEHETGAPTYAVPKLLEKCVPVHEVVTVDLFIPGCPPSAQAIEYALREVAAGRAPSIHEFTRFGA